MGGGKSQEQVQKFGRFLSGMVMPNIGAFITWGLITALFIPTGWLPNEDLSKLIGPMIIYLLPLLIGYTGGKMVGDSRGGVLGAIATIGVIVGVDIPMFIGAMVMGPLGGYVIKKFDEGTAGKVPAGFEMLIHNFSAGILGVLLALLAYKGIGPVVLALNSMLKAGVESIVNSGLLPLVALLIEPSKILFLNNAINHGILSPIGMQQAQEVGQSIFFLLETNPGPGLGILLAYWIFSKGMAKQSAPGAIIIHFFGGIHEIYFPYVLMNPMLLLAVIGGGAGGILTFHVMGAGLVATPSPGSIVALLAMTPKGGYIPVLAGVFVSTLISFLLAAVFIKGARETEGNLELREAQEKIQVLKSSYKGPIIRKVIVACDAGMGSSAMGATILRNKCKEAGLFIEVANCAIEAIPAETEIVITHEKLAQRARVRAPQAEHIIVKDFIENEVFTKLRERLAPIYMENIEEESRENEMDNIILRKSNILLGLKSMERDEAIRLAGSILHKSGYVEEEYIEAMIERERDLTTFIGKGLAIPHGVGRAKENIKKSGMVVLQFPEGVLFGDEVAYLVIGIAGVGNEHLNILSNIATAINMDDTDDIVEVLRRTTDLEYIHNLFYNPQ